jgi:hypothetical protein
MELIVSMIVSSACDRSGDVTKRRQSQESRKGNRKSRQTRAKEGKAREQDRGKETVQWDQKGEEKRSQLAAVIRQGMAAGFKVTNLCVELGLCLSRGIQVVQRPTEMI